MENEEEWCVIANCYSFSDSYGVKGLFRTEEAAVHSAEEHPATCNAVVCRTDAAPAMLALLNG